MTRWLQAARQVSDEGTEPAEPPPKPVKSVLSVLSEGESTNRVPPPSAKPDNHAPAPYGESPGGRVLTWTGRVVSLDAWRNLSEWERHGPKGRHWNGMTQKWEGPL